MSDKISLTEQEKKVLTTLLTYVHSGGGVPLAYTAENNEAVESLLRKLEGKESNKKGGKDRGNK